MDNYPEQSNLTHKAINDNSPATVVDEAQSWGEPQPAPPLAILELNYHQIANLYDMAEQLLATAEDERVLDHEQQLDLVEPLVAQIGESADLLCEDFIEVAGNKQANSTRLNRIEGALRRLYVAIDSYNEKADQMVKGALEGIRNIADPIIEKINHHIEFVITIFFDFIKLSLDRIMTKVHLLELKKRQEKLAHMLYMAERQASFERGA